MHDKLAFIDGILLESYQLTDATQLSWSYKSYKDKWLCFHIFKFTSLSTWLLYFWINTIFQLLLQLLIKAIISNTYYIFIRPLSRLLDFGFNDFIGLKKYAGSRWTTWPNVEFRTQLPKKNPSLVRSSLQWTTCGWAFEKGPQTKNNLKIIRKEILHFK